MYIYMDCKSLMCGFMFNVRSKITRPLGGGGGEGELGVCV